MDNLPVSWTEKRLREITTKPQYGYTARASSIKNGPKFIRITDITKENIDWETVPYCECPREVFQKYKLEPKDLLFARTGSTGSSILITDLPEPAVFASYLIRLKIKKGIEAEYINHFFKSWVYWKQIESLKVGAVQSGINASVLSSLKIPVPPLVEQRGIVEVLGTVDECIRLTDAVIERAEELKRGLMQQLLTRGTGHTEYKETPLGEIPITWKIYSISQLCELIVDCVNRTAPTVPFQTEFRMIRTSNIRNGKIDLSDVKYVTKEIYKKWTRREPPKKNDVILTREAPMGEVGIIQDEQNVFLGQRIVMYRCDPKRLDPFYLLYTLLSHPVQTQIHKLGSGSTVAHMRVPDSKKLKIITPPIGIQRKIAEILRNQDKRIGIEYRKKNNLNVLKEGLIQLLLSGKIRVELKGDGLHRIGDGREANN